MNRADAYAVLSRELESWRHRPYDQLVALVDRPESERTVRIEQEDIIVRVAVHWANEKKVALRLGATADGPSWFKLERLEESILVCPGEPGAG